jgi:ribonuclease P protein component
LERFPKSARLRKRREYRQVYDAGLRVAGRRLVLFVNPARGEAPRLGVTATRKTGPATSRNRAKRLVREAFRRHRSSIGPWDLVVNVRAGTSTAHFAEIERELLELIRRAARRLAPRS